MQIKIVNYKQTEKGPISKYLYVWANESTVS